MAAWDPIQPLPDTLADAFAVLYDWIESTAENYLVVENSRERFTAKRNSQTLCWQALVEASGWLTPTEMRTELVEAAKTGGDHLAVTAYRCLVAIDQGAGSYLPDGKYNSPTDPTFTLLSQYDEHGCYNTDAVGGYVLPKWTKGSRESTTLAHHMEHLVRARIDRARLSVIGRGHTAFTPRNSRRSVNTKVAIVPFLYGLDDLAFGPVDVGDEHFFEVSHRTDGGPTGLDHRVRSAVVAMRRSRAEIVVLPELVLNASLLRTLKKSLSETITKQSTLRWIIAGTSLPAPGAPPDHTMNKAVVLNGAGKVVAGQTLDGRFTRWEQPKRHRYRLSKEEQRRYGLVSCFGREGDECDRDEAIAVDQHGVVFEDRSGRYAVLICEDWGQNEDTYDALLQFRPRVVFVIVMDGPMRKERWAAKRAVDIVDKTGAFVVLANSLVLPNMPNCRSYMMRHYRHVDPLPDGRQPVGLLYGPREGAVKGKPFPRKFSALALPDLADHDSLISNMVTIPPHRPGR